eukprot:symbB.v1.2.000814.t1/scaffold44.1/size390916/27
MSHELGNELFAVVQQVQPELAPKLTGMLLDLGEKECWACLEDHEKLAKRLDEAMAILDAFHAEAPRASKAPVERAPEKRVDPHDGVARTFAELQKHYAGQYSTQEIKEYWDHCNSIDAKGGKVDRQAPAPKAKAAVPSKATVPSKAPQVAPKAAKAPATGPSAAPAKAVPKSAAPKAVVKAAPRQEVVPKLHAWLVKLQLESYLAAAEEWAEEQGAVSLEEIVEFGEDFAKDLKMKSLERKRVVEGGEAAMEEVENMPDTIEESDHDGDGADDEDGADDFHEGRNAQLDTERDIAALSRVDVEPMEPEQMALARPAPREGRRTPSSQPQGQRPPRTQPEPRPQPEPEQRRYGRGQGFGGEENGAAGGYYDKASASTGAAEAQQERRVDPEDGKAKTFRELQAEYTHLYSPHEISEYWNECARSTAGAAPPEKPMPKPVQPAIPAKPVGKSQPWGAGGSKLRF